MSKQKILELADLYQAELMRMGAVASRIDEGVLVVPGVSQSVLRDHLAWCCEHVRWLVTQYDQVAAAQQWVKFIQGALWAMGDFSIEDMRRHAAPATRAGVMAHAAISRPPSAPEAASP